MPDSFKLSKDQLSEEGSYLPAIEGEIILKDWLTIRGFIPTTRFDYADHLYEHGGELNIIPTPGMKHLICPEVDTSIEWCPGSFEDGVIKMPDGKGTGYGYAEYFSNGPRRAVIYTKYTAVFWINGTIYEGNRYGYEYYEVPVILEDGVNRVLVKTLRDEFIFKLLPATEPVLPICFGDVMAPDIILNEELDGWFSIPLINTTEKKLDVTINIIEDDLFQQGMASIKAFEPLSMEKPPLKLATKRKVRDNDLDTDPEVRIQIITEGHMLEVKVGLRSNKAPENGYITTYISPNDNSVQQYSVLPPSDFKAERQYGLIFTLHGAGVECGWTNFYSKKDFAYVVGPTNRRQYGFDWQDWGRINAFETLNEALARFDIDKNQIWLTGHSMGGHGTWSIGLQYPGMFAAMAPSAGWLGFDTYGKGRGGEFSEAPDKLKEIVSNVDCGNSAVSTMENALNIPVYVLHGDEDESVPVDQARQGVAMLRSLGYEVEYAEIPGKTHWWHDTSSGGTSCVDYTDMIEFLKGKRLNTLPSKIIYKVWDIGVNNSAYWISIDKQIVVFMETKIEVQVIDKHLIEINTSNVKQFTMDLQKSLVDLGKLVITINGNKVEVQLDRYGKVTVHMDENGAYVLGEPEKCKGLEKTINQYGPIKAGYFSPFVFVYGTMGDEKTTQLALSMARLEQYRWWRQGNGTVRIIPDTAVDDSIVDNYNLILFGGPEDNRITCRINSELPIQLEGKKFKIGGYTCEGKNLAAKFIYPNPLNAKKYVVVSEGNSMEGLRLSGLVPIQFSGSFLPDFVLYDENMKIKGGGELLAAGFFGNHWDLDPSSAFFSENLKNKTGSR